MLDLTPTQTVILRRATLDPLDVWLYRDAVAGEPKGTWGFNAEPPLADQEAVEDLLRRGLLGARVPRGMQNCEEAFLTDAGRAVVAALTPSA